MVGVEDSNLTLNSQETMLLNAGTLTYTFREWWRRPLQLPRIISFLSISFPRREMPCKWPPQQQFLGNVQEQYPIQLLSVRCAMQPFGCCLAILNKIDVFKLFLFSYIVSLMQYIPRLEQKRGIKSSVVIGSSVIFKATRIRLKTFPISLTPRLLTSQISLKVLGSFSCLYNQKKINIKKIWINSQIFSTHRQAMSRQVAALASVECPLRCLPLWTCLKSALALSTIVLPKFIRSAMVRIFSTALITVWSELLI